MYGLTKTALALATSATLAVSGLAVGGIVGAPDATAAVASLKNSNFKNYREHGKIYKLTSYIDFSVDYHKHDSTLHLTGTWGARVVDNKKVPIPMYRICSTLRINIYGGQRIGSGSVVMTNNTSTALSELPPKPTGKPNRLKQTTPTVYPYSGQVCSDSSPTATEAIPAPPVSFDLSTVVPSKIEIIATATNFWNQPPHGLAYAVPTKRSALIR